MITNIWEEPAASNFRVAHSTLYMEAADSSETSLSTYKTTQRHLAVDHEIDIHHHENLNSHMYTAFIYYLYSNNHYT